MTGDGFGVLISCECLPQHEWMSFACWYSLSKCLPDARAAIVCDRGSPGDLFHWTKRCGVPFLYHAGRQGDRKLWQTEVALDAGLLSLPMFVLEPSVLAVGELPEPGGSAASPDGRVWFLREKCRPAATDPSLCGAAKSEGRTAFVDYSGGWGNFVTAACITRGDYPFRRADRFHSGDVMTLNEIKILDLWRRMDRLFTAVSRG